MGSVTKKFIFQNLGLFLVEAFGFCGAGLFRAFSTLKNLVFCALNNLVFQPVFTVTRWLWGFLCVGIWGGVGDFIAIFRGGLEQILAVDDQYPRCLATHLVHPDQTNTETTHSLFKTFRP